MFACFQDFLPPAVDPGTEEDEGSEERDGDNGKRDGQDGRVRQDFGLRSTG